MSNLWKIPVTIFFLLLAPVAVANPPIVDDPDAFAARIIQLMASNKSVDAAKSIAVQVGKPELADNIGKALSILHDKKFDYTKKVIDKEYNGALRQIIYYAFIDGLNFVYFRFNYKMSSRGWVLANFFFKDEAQELFPKDIVSP